MFYLLDTGIVVADGFSVEQAVDCRRGAVDVESAKELNSADCQRRSRDLLYEISLLVVLAGQNGFSLADVDLQDVPLHPAAFLVYSDSPLRPAIPHRR